MIIMSPTLTSLIEIMGRRSRMSATFGPPPPMRGPPPCGPPGPAPCGRCAACPWFCACPGPAPALAGPPAAPGPIPPPNIAVIFSGHRRRTESGFSTIVIGFLVVRSLILSWLVARSIAVTVPPTILNVPNTTSSAVKCVPSGLLSPRARN